MLLLTRRVGEVIVIEGGIKIKLMGIKGSQARIGVEAPKNLSVHREEIQEKIDKEKSDEKKI